MVTTIQSNQRNVDKEEAIPSPEVASLPQERHIWRMPELPPIFQGLCHFKVAEIEAGGHELLLTHKEISGSGEDHRALRRINPIVLQRQGQKDEELVEKSKSFIHRPEEGTQNYSSFGERRPSGIYQLQKCLKTSPKDLRRSGKVSRAIKERAKAQTIGTYLTHRGTGYPNWSLQPWTVSSIWPDLSWNSQPKSRKG
ncbi:hypothetical protein O181_047275 [Austropuccinia psidii MF-1]|uniref:Uncharacterized protein n=1 Tax=Austropuccinia psidii MF-1 TaxID=1389203 RepID=A0A9Q3DV01_9BASI|nr:hypothetical protein [Austropuccinia psidii MF-1]